MVDIKLSRWGGERRDGEIRVAFSGAILCLLLSQLSHLDDSPPPPPPPPPPLSPCPLIFSPLVNRCKWQHGHPIWRIILGWCRMYSSGLLLEFHFYFFHLFLQMDFNKASPQPHTQNPGDGWLVWEFSLIMCKHLESRDSSLKKNKNTRTENIKELEKERIQFVLKVCLRCDERRCC